MRRELQGDLLPKKQPQGNLVASRSSENSGNPKAESRDWPHNFYMSSTVVPHMEKVHSFVRKIYGRSSTDDLDDFDVKQLSVVYS